MTWDNANKYCKNKGAGWRLPTRTEAKCMCDNVGSLPGGLGTAPKRYWTSTMSSTYGIYVYLNRANNVSCGTNSAIEGSALLYVKCVK
jgi:hypothetical protein